MLHEVRQSLSVLLQRIIDFVVAGTSFMIDCGHTSIHFPQPQQLLLITAVLLIKEIAFWLQTLAQSPRPIHAYLQSNPVP